MADWVELAGFEKDPYEKVDPFRIDEKYLSWNRPDLKQVRVQVDKFLEDVYQKKRVGLKLWGPYGSGKTWLCRVLELELKKKDPDVLFIYTKVPKAEPTFQVVYRIAIEHVLRDYFGIIKDKVQKKTSGVDRKSWQQIIGENELAIVLAHYHTDTNRALANKWLIGDSLSASELRELNVVSSVDSDFDRQEMLKTIVRVAGPIFSTVVLVVDELENARKLAGALGDIMREMLDGFSERFALVASFTAQRAEEWYDLGYSEGLNRRIDYAVGLEALDRERVSDFLRAHNALYRKEDAKTKDQLYPFTEEGAIQVLDSTFEGNRYPGYYLSNCRDIAQIAMEKKVVADKNFVLKNEDKMRFRQVYAE